jgi:hypothetical protein
MKKKLRKDWEQACNAYVNELLRMWELDSCHGFWIGEDVGGIYDYGCGMFTIVIDDIIYCVENGVTRRQYIGWQEYCCDAAEFGFDQPNLKAWMHGCPRTSEKMFKMLRKLKANLDAAIREENERARIESVNGRVLSDADAPGHGGL